MCNGKSLPASPLNGPTAEEELTLPEKAAAARDAQRCLEMPSPKPTDNWVSLL